MVETPKQRSFEIRAGLMLLRVVGVLLCVAYVLMTSVSSVAWMQTYWTRQQPLAAVQTKLQQSLDRNDPDILSRWIFRRKMDDMPDIVASIEPQTGQVSSLIFMRHAQYFSKHDDEKSAVFWYLYSRYRLRYDALRCGAPSGPNTMNKVLSILTPEDMDELVPDNTPALAALLQRVLDYDAKHPAENNPADICQVVQRLTEGNFALVPREHWTILRHTLRLATQQSIDEMASGKKPD